jgi:hypothetical protein
MADAKLCDSGAHNYVPTGGEYRERASNTKDTNIMRTFYCTKCCDVQARIIAVWQDFIPAKRAKGANAPF